MRRRSVRPAAGNAGRSITARNAGGSHALRRVAVLLFTLCPLWSELFVTALEIKQVRQLHDQASIDQAPCGCVPPLVVDHVQIAHWMVDEVEARVRAELVRARVVLKE